MYSKRYRDFTGESLKTSLFQRILFSNSIQVALICSGLLKVLQNEVLTSSPKCIYRCNYTNYLFYKAQSAGLIFFFPHLLDWTILLWIKWFLNQNLNKVKKKTHAHIDWLKWSNPKSFPLFTAVCLLNGSNLYQTKFNRQPWKTTTFFFLLWKPKSH